MRNQRIYPLFIILALLLAACGGENETPAANVPAGTAGEGALRPAEDAPTPEPTLDPAFVETDDDAPLNNPDSSAPVAAEFTGPVTFVIEEGSASYSVDEEVFNQDVRFMTAIGRTTTTSGQITLDLSNPEPVLIDGRFEVDISTLESDSERRDQAIREEWLESATYPIATFVPRRIQFFPTESYVPGEPVTFQLVGDMTVRDVTIEETIWDVTATLNDGRLRGEADAFIFMTDFGFEPPSILNILEVVDGVEVRLNFVATAQ